jgi:hypothetical protein
MGLIRFLRRQFAGPGSPLEPLAPSVPPAFRVRQIVTASLSAPPQPQLQAQLPASPPSTGLAPASRPAGDAVLHFSERRDARYATFNDPDVHREILRLHEMINQLHRQRRRLREDRDKWERLARELERELVAARSGEQGGAANPLIAADKFRRAKMVLARLTHPDASGATGIEAGIRATLFREFWAEFERIEREASAKPTRLVGR